MKEINISKELEGLYKKYMPDGDYEIGVTPFDSTKMTSKDYELSKKLLEYYDIKNDLDSSYNSGLQSIKENQQTLLNNNYVNQQKALKYMPQYLSMTGAGNTGLTESTLLKTKNYYDGNKMAIDSSAMSQAGSLKSEYDDKIEQIKQNYRSDKTDINDAYEEIKKGVSDNIKAGQLTSVYDVDKLTDFDENEKAQFKVDVQNANFKNYKDQLKTAEKGGYDLTEMSNALKIDFDEGNISEDQFKEINGMIAKSNLETLKSFGLYSDYSLVKKTYEDLYKDNSITKETYDELASELDAINMTKGTLSNYGVDLKGNSISATSASESDFGRYYDSGRSGTNQYRYVNSIINAAIEGNIPDYALIDFNYGKGGVNERGSVHIYYGGRWYKTNLSRKEASKLNAFGFAGGENLNYKSLHELGIYS